MFDVLSNQSISDSRSHLCRTVYSLYLSVRSGSTDGQSEARCSCRVCREFSGVGAILQRRVGVRPSAANFLN